MNSNRIMKSIEKSWLFVSVLEFLPKIHFKFCYGNVFWALLRSSKDERGQTLKNDGLFRLDIVTRLANLLNINGKIKSGTKKMDTSKNLKIPPLFIN